MYLWRLPWQQAADQLPFPRMPHRFLHSNHFLWRKQNQPWFSHMRFPPLHDASYTALLRHRIGLFKNLPERKILIRLYSPLPITWTLVKLEPKSISSGFPPSGLYASDFLHTFTVILPSVTRTFDNTNLPLTRNNFTLVDMNHVLSTWQVEKISVN